MEKWKKEEGKKKRKEGKYPYFVFLFNISHYDGQRSLQKKQGRISKIFKGWGKILLGAWP